MRIIEGEYDDRPLPGPWNRRREESYRGPEDRVPGPWEEEAYGAGGRDDDLPLPGPWNRRQFPELPGSGPEGEVPGPGDNAGYGPGIPASEPDSVPARFDTAGEAAESADAVEEVRNEGGKPVSGRRRRSRGYMRKLFCPAGIYAGVIMAEVLGARGGRSGRRSPVFGRRF